ncbi:MAG: MFS transporter [Patescibacteria group bacterium]
MAFFLALASALPAYIQSSYLGSYIGLSAITWFFIISNVVSFFTILVFPKFIKKFDSYFSAGIVSVIFILSLLGMGVTSNIILLLIAFIAMQVSMGLIWINMDLFVESFSKNATTGQTRTIYFTIINLAWIASPSLSAYVMQLSDYRLVYFVAALILAPFLATFIFTARDIKHKISNQKNKISVTAIKMLKSKNLRGVFILALLLNLFYNSAVIFIPIYLNKIIGFSWHDLGWMFSLMLIPFILVEIPAGIIADKYLGEKELFYFGFTIIIVCLSLFSLLDSHNPWLWATILFLSRVGAALVEAMSETYFFKNVGAKDINKINLFRCSIPMGRIIGSLLSLLMLIILPLRYLFVFTAIIMLSSFYYLRFMKDTK